MFIQKYIKSIIFAIIVAISLYLVSAIIIGWEDSVTLIKKISIIGWLSLIACSFTNYLIRYSRWSYFISRFGHSIPHKLHLLYYLSAFALTVTPAKVGETIRSLYLFNHGIEYTKSISAFFVERLLDLTIITILSSLLLYQNNDYQFFIIVLSCTIVALLLLLKSNFIPPLFNFIATKIKSAKLTKLLATLRLLLEHSKALLQNKPLSLGAMLGVISWTIQGTAFYILLNQLGFDLPIYIAISIYSIALLSGALSFIPGGIGSTEIVMGIFLYYFGAPKDIIVIAPIIIRITSLWFAVLIGLIATITVTKIVTDKPN